MLLRLSLILSCLFFAILPAEAKRVALVIGNSTYAEVGELNNPHADAIALAKAFQDAKFDDVKLLENLDFEHMRIELREFSSRAAGAEIAVIYYAGHGVEMPGQNYLIPVDAKLLRSADIVFEAITLDSVRSAVSGATILRMVVLDACRNNPFKLVAADGKKRAATRGLAAVEPGVGEFIAYSAKEGTLAQDGPTDGNSPFATALLKSLSRSGIDIRLMFGQVRDDVLEATGREQEPYTYNSLGGEAIYLIPPEDKPAVSISPPDPIAADFDLARSMGTKAAWDLFLARHGTASDMRADVAKQERDKLALLVPLKPAAPECSGVQTKVQGENKCLAIKETFSDCNGCPEMVVVPAGSFMMGSPADEKDRQDDEGPQHKVALSSAFAVGKFEVTRGQFAEFVKDANYTPGSSCWILYGTEWKETAGKSFRDTGFTQSDDHPVACVSWDEAQAYVKWLSKKSGVGYRLLTEAEWEYAARAGTTTAFPTGTTITATQANFNYEKQATTVAGTYTDNKFGLFDMAGNVWEWTEDCYEESYKNADASGKATKGSSCERVDRGGGWDSGPQYLRSAVRDRDTAVVRDGDLGFRLARTF